MALSLLGVPAACAATQELAVSATVLKRATLQVLAQPAAVVITEADIRRGYVDVPNSADFAIRNNSPQGYMLDFASEGEFFRGIQVRGLGHDVQMGPNGGMVAQPGAGWRAARMMVALRFRFVLSESAQAGTYPWPVRVSVAPI